VITITIAVPIPVASTVVTVAISVPVSEVAVISSTVIPVGGTTMTHVLSRSGGMGAVGDRVINTNATTVKFNAVQLLNTLCGLLNGAHFYKSKAARTVGLPLVVNNGDLFDTTIPTEFVVEVALLSSDAQSEDSKNIGRSGLLFARWRM